MFHRARSVFITALTVLLALAFAAAGPAGADEVTDAIQEADSPMLQSFIMMLANPMLAASDGGKLEKIAGQKALVKYDPSEKEGDIRIVVANRFLVTVQGSGVAREDLKAYAGAVDYGKLSEMP